MEDTNCASVAATFASCRAKAASPGILSKNLKNIPGIPLRLDLSLLEEESCHKSSKFATVAPYILRRTVIEATQGIVQYRKTPFRAATLFQENIMDRPQSFIK